MTADGRGLHAAEPYGEARRGGPQGSAPETAIPAIVCGRRMEAELGIVCGRCDWYGAMGQPECSSCGNALTLGEAASKQPVSKTTRVASSPPAAAPLSLFEEQLKPRRSPSASCSRRRCRPAQYVPRRGETAVSSSGALDDAASSAMRAKARSGSEPALEELMDQAKNYVCKSCSTPVPMGHKFCGRCGAAVPPDILNARTQFFGQLQVPGKAKLILIRGEGVEGLSYQLNADQHIVGRNGQLVFPDDPFVSPRHANLFYRTGKLVVRDEGSLNGVFWRVRGSVEVSPGDHFLAGEQLFRVEGPPKANDGPAPDGTYFYSSPKHQTQFKIVQILPGARWGWSVCPRHLAADRS